MKLNFSFTVPHWKKFHKEFLNRKNKTKHMLLRYWYAFVAYFLLIVGMLRNPNVFYAPIIGFGLLISIIVVLYYWISEKYMSSSSLEKRYKFTFRIWKKNNIRNFGDDGCGYFYKEEIFDWLELEVQEDRLQLKADEKEISYLWSSIRLKSTDNYLYFVDSDYIYAIIPKDIFGEKKMEQQFVSLVQSFVKKEDETVQ